MKENKQSEMKTEKCECHSKCPCGENCICTEDNKCAPECKCWQNNTPEITRVKKIAQGLKKLADENLNLAKYQKAEFENFKKRQAEAVNNAFNEGKTFVIINVLPVLDSLTEALKIITNLKDREGIEILYRKLESILTSVGLEEIKTEIGEKFDPNVHNAVATEVAEGKSAGVILEEWQKGYKLGGRVVRPSTVKVSE